MSSTIFIIRKVSIHERVLIVGKWWILNCFSPTQMKANAKEEDKSIGECYFKAKRITFHPVQHREELLDTLMHERLQAILAERSYKHDLER